MKTLQFLLEQYAEDHNSREVLKELDRLIEDRDYISKPYYTVHIESKPRLGIRRVRLVCSSLVIGKDIASYIESKSKRVVYTHDSYSKYNYTFESFENDIYEIIREYTLLYICK